MSDLEQVSTLLNHSLDPVIAKDAEKSLKSQESSRGFPITLLHVVASTNLPISTRLAGALFLKNLIKRGWVNENGDHLLPDADLIKEEIIPLMITLPNNLQVQIGEAISTIADSDFPEKWPSLIDNLVNRLSDDDMITNKGVLTVAHSIFKRWRPLFRSDELFLEIKSVLEKFCVPFMHLLKRVDSLIDQNSQSKAQLLILFDVLLLLVKIYYDLNCQDIPEFFEDNLNDGMSVIHKYLVYSNDLFGPESADEFDSEIDILTSVKTSISDLIQLYTTRYEDIFEPLIPQFIQSSWNLLTAIGIQSKYDLLVSRLLLFLSSVVKAPKHFQIFNSENALKEITERIIIPNLTVRPSDEELFEDDPIEYIRRDLEGADTDTRRKASIDFLRELKLKNENLVTQVVSIYINNYLQEYQERPQEWKFKDLSIYLFTALAAKGSSTKSGLQSTNLLLDVVDFFTKNIIDDLLNDNIHPILKVDAIKFIYLFKNQLTKPQLLESFSILSKHLESVNFVEYTYSAITIERILSIRDSTTQRLMFSKRDIEPFVGNLLSRFFGLVLKDSSSPEKLAENEFLMKAIMRSLLIAEDSISGISVELLKQLLSIVEIISKNPSNPKFSHFTFESIAVLIKFNYQSNYANFVDQTIPVFLQILGLDVQEFVPYIFQIFAYLLEISPESTLSAPFRQLATPLLSPSVWQYKGNIPAVTRLLQAIISKDYSSFQDITALLGVFQKLIASKANENFGFDLLETVISNFPKDSLENYNKQLAILLLQRLQNSRTEKFVKRFIIFLSKLTIIKDSAFAISYIDLVQPGIFGTIYEQFFLPSALNIGNLLDRKFAVVGLTNFLSSSQFLGGDYFSLATPTLEVLIKISSTESVFTTRFEIEDSAEFEETSSFGSSYSRLSAIIAKPFDPIPNVDNYYGGREFFVQTLKRLDLESGHTFLNQLKTQLTEENVKALLNLIA